MRYQIPAIFRLKYQEEILLEKEDVPIGRGEHQSLAFRILTGHQFCHLLRIPKNLAQDGRKALSCFIILKAFKTYSYNVSFLKPRTYWFQGEIITWRWGGSFIQRRFNFSGIHLVCLGFCPEIFPFRSPFRPGPGIRVDDAFRNVRDPGLNLFEVLHPWCRFRPVSRA